MTVKEEQVSDVVPLRQSASAAVAVVLTVMTQSTGAAADLDPDGDADADSDARKPQLFDPAAPMAEEPAAPESRLGGFVIGLGPATHESADELADEPAPVDVPPAIAPTSPGVPLPGPYRAGAEGVNEPPAAAGDRPPDPRRPGADDQAVNSADRPAESPETAIATVVSLAVASILGRRKSKRGSETHATGQAGLPVPAGPGPFSSRKLSRLFRIRGTRASNRFDSRVYFTS